MGLTLPSLFCFVFFSQTSTNNKHLTKNKAWLELINTYNTKTIVVECYFSNLFGELCLEPPFFHLVFEKNVQFLVLGSFVGRGEPPKV